MSNLLKKASIITTPTAYDDGRILSVKPSENLYGPELVTNGDFSNGTTGWSSPDYNSTLSIVNGQMKIVSTLSLGRVSQAITTEVGKKYLISATTTNINSSTGIQIKVSNGANLDGATYSSEFNATTNPLTITHRFIATATTTYIGSSQGSSVGQSALLDNVSVVEDLSGDFDFSRGSAATRVNAQGLVENVQILSSELVQNGNFSEIGSEEVSNGDFSQEGSESLLNANFESSSGWNLNNDSYIQGAELYANTGGLIYQAGRLTNGKWYKVEINVTSVQQDGFNVYANGTQSSLIDTAGVHTLYIQAGTSNSLAGFNPQSHFIGVIRSFSFKEVGQNWTIGSGWSIGDDKLVSVNGANYVTSPNATIVAGKTYKISYEVKDYISGTFGIRGYTVAGITATANGTYTDYITSNGPTITLLGFGTFNGSVTNISVKEVLQDWEVEDYGGVSPSAVITPNTEGVKLEKTVSADWRSSFLVQPISYTIGSKYKVTFKLKNGNLPSGGDVFVRSEYSSSSQTIESNIVLTNDWVEYTYHYEADSNSTDISFGEVNWQNAGVGQYFYINNVSVVEVTDDTDLPRINYEGFSYQDVLGSELITNGDFAVDGSWVKGTGWTISGGSANGSSTTSDLYQENVVVAGKKYKVTYTISNYVSGSVRVELPNNSSAGTERSANGTYTETILSGGTLVLFDARTSFTGSIDNVSVKEVTGQEVVPNSGCGSWLFEPQRTNLVTYSESFSGWVLDDATIVGSNTISPNGTQNAVLLKGNTNSSRHHIEKTYSQQNSNTAFSVFVKAKELKYVQIATANDVNQYANFDVSSGVIGTVGSTFSDAKIEAIGSNGWYLLSVVATRSNGLYISLVSGLTASWLESWTMSNNTDGLYIWGAQAEVGAYPTSYIPTNGAASTRLQDIANNSGNSTLINSTEGVLYAEIAALANDGTYRIFSLSDGTTNERVYIQYTSASNTVSAVVKKGGVTQANKGYVLSDETDFAKVAFKFKQNDFALWVNGIEVGTDTSGNTPTGLSELAFDDADGGNKFYGKTKALAVFKEALTDTELQALTKI